MLFKSVSDTLDFVCRVLAADCSVETPDSLLAVETVIEADTHFMELFIVWYQSWTHYELIMEERFNRFILVRNCQLLGENWYYMINENWYQDHCRMNLTFPLLIYPMFQAFLERNFPFDAHFGQAMHF